MGLHAGRKLDNFATALVFLRQPLPMMLDVKLANVRNIGNIPEAFGSNRMNAPEKRRSRRHGPPEAQRNETGAACTVEDAWCYRRVTPLGESLVYGIRQTNESQKPVTAKGVAAEGSCHSVMRSRVRNRRAKLCPSPAAGPGGKVTSMD